MIFDHPISFAEAQASRAAKALMPTRLNSAALSAIDASIRERALFSARVTNRKFLEAIDEVVGRIIDPQQAARPGNPLPVETGETAGSARDKLRAVLEAIHYQAPKGKEGTMEDLSSNARLDLITRVQTELAQGYGNWVAGMDPDVLVVFPCAELKRVESREVPRGTKEGYPDKFWQHKWQGLGGRLYRGRMICRKDDPIMSAISDFGVPYGPPGFNSGYEWEDVDVREARALGVLKAGETVTPQHRDFAADAKKEGEDAESWTGGDGRVADYGNEALPSIEIHPGKQRLEVHGLHIIIENPKGSVRSGVDPDGKPWSVAMPADYGEIHGFRGADGDYVDCYVGDSFGDNVLVIDQCNIFKPGRPFDEHKCFIDFATDREARETYLKGYTDGRGAERIAGETRMGMAEFKAWLRDKAKTKKPTLQAANAALITQLDNERLIANAAVSVKAHLRHLKTGGVAVVRQHERKGMDALTGFPAVADPSKLTPDTMLKESVYNRALRSMYFDPVTGDKVAGSRETPMERMPLTVGMWRVDDGWKGAHGHMISQLRELDPDALEHSENLVEQNIEGRGGDAERYADWMREGRQAPPIEVVVADRTNALRITDGHRRATAAKRAGKKILAWVSPSAPHPEGYRYDSDPKQPIIPVALTYEIATGKAYPRE